MKRIFYYIAGIWLAVCLLASCKEDTPLPYDGLTGITFQSVNFFTDRLGVDAVYPSATDTNFVREYFFTYDDEPNAFRIFQAPLAVLGYTVDFDRPVSIEIDPSSTVEPGSYEIATDLCAITSGNVQGTLSIKVNRPDANDTSVKKLVVKLVPNDYFSYVNGDGQYFICNLSNANYKPRYWDLPLYNVMMTDYFGIYSNNKFDFIHEVLSTYEEEDYATGEMTHTYMKYSTLEGFRDSISKGEEIQAVLKKAYEDRIEAGGDPIYDENTGKEIVFGY